MTDLFGGSGNHNAASDESSSPISADKGGRCSHEMEIPTRHKTRRSGLPPQRRFEVNFHFAGCQRGLAVTNRAATGCPKVAKGPLVKGHPYRTAMAGRRLTVLSVAYPQFQVTANSAGGAEQILYLLERGITNAGHRSITIAASGSSVIGELVETPRMGTEINASDRREASRVHRERIQEVLQRTAVDLIHFHGLDFDTYFPEFGGPMLVTVHLPAAWYANSALGLPGVQFCCVSYSQAQTFPYPDSVAVIPNGVDTEAYSPRTEKSDTLLWLGRICPEKGVHIALRVAHKLDLPLIVAGPLHPFRDHQHYFVNEVKPRLDEKRRWVGSVGLNEKALLLASAKCLLIPSLAPETSSLVAMEAASSSTPVIAFRSGALPEIVEHERTGFVVDGEEEMAAAVAHTREISGRYCRQRALEHFSAERMVNEYLDLYRGLTSSV